MKNKKLKDDIRLVHRHLCTVENFTFEEADTKILSLIMSDRLSEYARKILLQMVHENLYETYREEFEIIDGLNQHPSGKTFEEWMEE